ncbi:MAG TPA: hypothetical protein VLU46_07225, partial [Thermoanaerobaculia bacterium]|nr:hypothetical protein [Thermoanaerobaculia bacterium]
EIRQIKTTGRGEEEGNSWYEVKLREGRNQQIRRMFKAIGHPVMKLRRVGIGPLADASLQPGEWRELTDREVKALASMKEPKPKTARPAKKRGAAAVRGRRSTGEDARRSTKARRSTRS